VPVSTYPVDEATTDIRDLQRMPTTGLIETEVDNSAAVSFCVCGGTHWTDTHLPPED
jgi:hypothetical protein